MGLTLQDIYDCRSGYRDTIVVGELPDALRRKLMLKTGLVYLKRSQLQHINDDHPELRDFDLARIPHVIETGLLLQEVKKPKVVLAVGKDKDSHRYFAAVMKIVESYELWLSSFYQVRGKHLARFRKKAAVLREPQDTK